MFASRFYIERMPTTSSIYIRNVKVAATKYFRKDERELNSIALHISLFSHAAYTKSIMPFEYETDRNVKDREEKNESEIERKTERKFRMKESMCERIKKKKENARTHTEKRRIERNSNIVSGFFHNFETD